MSHQQPTLPVAGWDQIGAPGHPLQLFTWPGLRESFRTGFYHSFYLHLSSHILSWLEWTIRKRSKGLPDLGPEQLENTEMS